jgi:hypothetical protein
MSTAPRPVTQVIAVRRVRHEVRDGVAVMVFSVATSVVLGLLMTFLAGLGK